MTTANQASGNGAALALNLYVSDINGLDTNNGLTPQAPLKTLTAARLKWAGIHTNNVVVHMGAHAGAGYTWAPVDNIELLGTASICFYGDGAAQPGEDGFVVVVGSTAALAGSTDSLVKSAALVADAYFGNTIEILTGAAAGDRRTIKENTTTDILSPTRFTAAVGTGDTYRIVRPSVQIAIPNSFTTPTILCTGLGRAMRTGVFFGQTVPARSAMVLANLEFASSGTMFIESQESLIQFFGVSLDLGLFNASGELDFGITSNQQAIVPALVASTTAWHGWAVTRSGGGTTFFLEGSATRRGVFVGDHAVLSDGLFEFMAGRIKAPSGAGLSIGFNHGNPRCVIGTHGSGPTAYLGVKIDTIDGECINMSLAWLDAPSLGPDAPLVLTSVTGTGILVKEDATCSISAGHNFPGGFSLTTGGWGVSVLKGGIGIFDHDMFNFVTATLGDFTLDEVIGVDGSELMSSYPRVYLAHSDGSTILSGD